MITEIMKSKRKERSLMRSDRHTFREKFSGKNALIIAEIKPKKPGNTTAYNPKIIAENILARNDIAGFSILVDREYFSGSAENIELIRETKKPTLFKEFVFETSQIDGAKYYGYDAVLLIRKIVTMEELKKLINYCHEKNIEPLIEIDNPTDLDEVINSFSPKDITIGINCRNLDTMEIDRKNHFGFWRDELRDYHLLALSGITDFAQRDEYRGKYDGVLIGSLFMN